MLTLLHAGATGHLHPSDFFVTVALLTVGLYLIGLVTDR